MWTLDTYLAEVGIAPMNLNFYSLYWPTTCEVIYYSYRARRCTSVSKILIACICMDLKLCVHYE